MNASLEQPESTSQTTSRSVQQFLHGDRQATLLGLYSVTIGRIYVRSSRDMGLFLDLIRHFVLDILC